MNSGDQGSLLSTRAAPAADTVTLEPHELRGWARLSSTCTDPDIRVAVLHFIPNGNYSYGLELWVREGDWSLDVITLDGPETHPTGQPATLAEWHEFRIQMDATGTTGKPGDPPPVIRLQIDEVVDDVVEGNPEANDLREPEIILGVTGPINPKPMPLTEACAVHFDQVVFEPVE